jgi:hypothetical protein
MIARIRRSSQLTFFFALSLAFASAVAATAIACPFCSAIKPTLSQRCDSSTEGYLAECVTLDAKAKPASGEFSVRKVLKAGESKLNRQTVRAAAPANIKTGSLVLLLGTNDPDSREERFEWEITPLNEASFAYIARLPNERTPVLERLKYFAPFLEHADPLISEDAFLEFGHAPYDQVLRACSFISAAKLRQWINDPAVKPERKGFYGLALGLTAQGDNRAANQAVLEKLVSAPATLGSDFRAGFDGVLSGYLIATNGDGIDQIKSRFIDDPVAAEGDVRHVQSALRFYYEFGPADDRPAVVTAVEHMLNRPGVAAAAITDLARWQQWSQVDRIAKLYPSAAEPDAALQRAVVGYLTACPFPTAEAALEVLRQRDAAGIAAAEQALSSLNGGN